MSAARVGCFHETSPVPKIVAHYHRKWFVGILSSVRGITQAVDGHSRVLIQQASKKFGFESPRRSQSIAAMHPDPAAVMACR